MAAILAATQALLSAAQTATESMLRKWGRNAVDRIELLTAQSSLEDAQLQYARAQVELGSALLRLYISVGNWGPAGLR